MLISVEDSLIDIIEGLKKMGYEIYRLSDGISSDAYIFSEKNTGLHNLNNNINPAGEGSLLVDADGKSLSDIVYILNHRLYSPLFNVTYNNDDFV